MYDERFPIKDGSITAGEIDEMYCFSDVMPGCTLRLGPLSPSDRYKAENAVGVEATYVAYMEEEPEGTFRGLLAEETYWVYVIQDKDQEAKDREQMRQTLAAHSQHAGDDGSGGGATERPDDGRGGMESCSCIYGNPCVDEYGCKDWHNRFAIAKKNGWKGF